MNPNFIEILAEEPSMENFLRVILPVILPEDYQLDVNCFIHPHEGKNHLKKSIPRKLRAYQRSGYPVKVLIIHDQDSNDCLRLKNEFDVICQSNITIPYLIRIACRELENWYLGDFQSIEKVYPEIKASKYENKAKFRNPDNVSGSHELELMTKNFTKSFASREIPKYMDIQNNKSKSFNHFITGLEKLVEM
ncbi:MAG: DUF4276 family protein [Bacteroidales bacterium]|nr:DUF4276 family protein [Bacteroidales bacterium]MCF8454938.1 DUF4276 family protein [Bacteroidales bacterium]